LSGLNEENHRNTAIRKSRLLKEEFARDDNFDDEYGIP
jgi:hypothetical protein